MKYQQYRGRIPKKVLFRSIFPFAKRKTNMGVETQKNVTTV